MKYNYDEYVEMMDEGMDRFSKLLELHREIEDENDRHLRQWKDEQK